MTTLDDLRKAEIKAKAKLQAKAERDALLTPIDHRKAPTLTPSELGAIQKRAYTTILIKQYSEHYRQQMDEEPDDFFNPSDPQDALVTSMLTTLHAKKTESSSTHILLTVNVKPEVTLEMMVKKINKMTKKKWINDYIIAIEQRAELSADLGTGLHFHAIIPRSIEPARARKELKSTFNSVCDTSNVHCMNMRWLKEKELPKVIKYLQGQKKDSSKDAKCQMDILFRQLNKLPSLLYPNTSIMAQNLLMTPTTPSENSTTTEFTTPNPTSTSSPT